MTDTAVTPPTRTQDGRCFILGTAGHVDHGKTTLIKALTGIETDRLPEEKARGLSIDLGFAHMVLPSKRVAGIVDVPGHERFLKNMLAGVGGFDMVLLVVDAAESVMPQTREHMEILQQLCIPAGVVALTKADLVDADFLQMAHEELAEYLRGTFLEKAPIVHVSGLTGQGLPELLNAIDHTLDGVPPRPLDKPAYLPIDRVFIKQGFGTVVTGSMWSGRFTKGERAVLMPDNIEVKVRGLQVHGEQRDEAVAGQRVAVNLGGVDADKVHRGQVLLPQGQGTPSTRVDVHLQVLARLPRPLKNRSRIRIYFGTQEALGKVILLDADQLEGGASGMCQFVLEEPVVARRGDRFVVRNSTAELTVGGGHFLEINATTHHRKDERTLEILRQKEEGEADNLVKAFLLAEVERPRTPGEVADGLKVERAVAQQWLQDMEERDEIVYLAEGKLVLLASSFSAMQEKIRDMFVSLEQKAPWKTGWRADEVMKLVSQRPNKGLAEVLSSLVARGVLKLDRGLLSSASHVPRLEPAHDKARQKLLAEVRKSPLATPLWEDVKTGHGFDNKTWAVLSEFLLDSGEVVFLNKEVWVLRETLEEVQDKVRGFIQQNGSLTPAQARDILGTSRKYIIPLLEYMDNNHLTKRSGDARILY